MPFALLLCFVQYKAFPFQSGSEFKLHIFRECYIRDFTLKGFPATQVICGKITGIFQFEDHARTVLGLEQKKRL
jgi:hypothetical protein